MKKIDASKMDYRELNRRIRESGDSSIRLSGVNGQRYIGCGLAGREIWIEGTPGNALGALMDGSVIRVEGDGQDEVGDTMNDGAIYIDGDCGDAAGYAMRGGAIYIRGDAGYRAGIHMKAYREKQPVIVIGGCAGSFLGEYQAGGSIVVLGIGAGGKAPVYNFTGTGMHGGHIYLASDSLPHDLPAQVTGKKAGSADKERIGALIAPFCAAFSLDKEALLQHNFFVLTPNSANPYKELYTNV